jgi:MFS family permease
MTGVSAIQYYSVTIFGQMGISGSDSLKYQAYNSIIALGAQFLCMLFIDYTGRRWPLILGNLGNCITFIIATILLAKYPADSNAPNTHHDASWAFIAMTWLYNFSFSATCGPLSWIIPAEIFDTRTRAKGVSIATMTSFAFNTMIGQTTSTAMKTIKYRWYFLFCVSDKIYLRTSYADLGFRSAISRMPSFSGHSCRKLQSGRSRR